MHKRTLAGTLSAVMITGALSALSVGSAEAATQSTVAVDAATLAGGATSTAGLFSAKETDYANTGSSAFVAGPDGATAPGSLELRTEATHSGSQNDKIYAGKTLLDVPVGTLDRLAYTVRTAPANNDATAPYLQMYVQDANTTFSSLVFDPNDAASWSGPVGAKGSWTTYDAAGDNAQWRNTRTLDGHAAGTYMTLAQWAADDSSLVTHPGFGAVVVVAGQTSEDASWSNYRAQLDQLVVGISGDTTTYDFGTALGDCATNTDLVTETATLTADCTTATTLSVPDGWTIDGNGHKVIATETAGSSFSGAVLQNAGTSMHVRDLTVETTADWAGDGKNSGGNLAGIRFKNADGSLDNVTVSGISHGNGVQEGNAVDVDNFGGATQRVVTADDITVSNYQKTGVRANGNVKLVLSGSDIGRAGGPTGASLDTVTAANSLQVSRGADAVVTDSHIVGNDYDKDASTSATAVLLYQAGDVTFTRNVIDGAGVDSGVDASGTSGNLVVSCNLVSRTADNDGGLDVWNTGLTQEGGAVVTAIDNTVQGYQTPTHQVTNVVNQGTCRPSAPAVTVDDVTTDAATVTWTAGPAFGYAPVDGWELTGPKGVVELGPEVTSYHVAGLEAGRAYPVSLRALNTSGASTWTNQVFTTTALPAPAAAPGEVDGLKATSVNPTGFVLSWNTADDATGYEVLVDGHTTTATGTTANVTGLAPATLHVVQVRGTNGTGNGAWSPAVLVTTQATTAYLKAPPVTVYGGKATVTGWLKVDGQPAAGRVVTLWRDDSGRWVSVGTATTLANGTWSKAFVPTKSAALRATADGFPTMGGTAVVATKVTVTKKGHTLTVTAGPRLGKNTVTVQKMVKGAWRTVHTGTLPTSAVARMAVTSAGTYRVVVAAKSGYAAGISAAIRVA